MPTKYINWKRLAKFCFFSCTFPFLLLLNILILFPSRTYADPGVLKTMEPGLKVELVSGNEIYVRACTTKEFDPSDWSERLLLRPEKSASFVTGNCIKVPFAELNYEYQLEAIRALFPRDSHNDAGWVHKVTYASSQRRRGETLWSISKWFTGDAQNYPKIMKYNKMTSRSRLSKGTTIKIPLDVLAPAFKESISLEIAARKAAEAPTAEAKRLNGDLTLKTDAQGPYASYRLKVGDTIYSKVVMRYTDRVTAEDVLEAVKLICVRSGIMDTRRLKAGNEIKIPLDLLSSMYLPPDDPRRQEYERVKEEAEQYSNPVKTADLAGITVILDPGHGGNDPGTIGSVGRMDVYEDEIVYDIMCRIKRILESTTMAKVISTVVDKSGRYEPKDESFFQHDLDECVLTTPVYENDDPKVSVNLRWYLANSLFRKMVAEGASPDKIVFVSLHADSLYPEARGTMVYIPDTYLCGGSGGMSGYVYTSRAEVREKQYLVIPYKSRVRSEGLSGEFANYLVNSLSEYGIRVHPEKPVRTYVIRRRRRWVPAVIRHNLIPTKMLVEVANLNNPQDCQLATDPAFRENYAAAFVHALKQYYGGEKVAAKQQPVTQQQPVAEQQLVAPQQPVAEQQPESPAQ